MGFDPLVRVTERSLRSWPSTQVGEISVILARYVLTIHSPDVIDASEGSADEWERTDARVLADLPARLEAVAEDLEDLLPEGYTVSIEPETTL